MLPESKHVKFMNLATNMAYKSTSKFRLGAVLVKKKRVISTGYNDMSRTHPIMRDRRFNPTKLDKSLHAEVAVCIGMSADELKDATLYVVRVLKNGHLSMAKPCKICTKFLVHMGIFDVFYTNAVGDLIWTYL